MYAIPDAICTKRQKELIRMVMAFRPNTVEFTPPVLPYRPAEAASDSGLHHLSKSPINFLEQTKLRINNPIKYNLFILYHYTDCSLQKILDVSAVNSTVI